MRWLLPFACAAWLLLAGAAHAGSPDPYLFESSAPGLAGGGLSISATNFHGHSFRVTERVRVSEIGGQFSSFQPVTVYGALYSLGTPVSPAQVVTDSTLLATALLDIPGGNAPADISADMDVELEPGWYAIGFGTGRHGATASAFSATMNSTGNPTAPKTYGPWSINVGTGAMVLQSGSFRFFLRGEAIAAAPAEPTRFLWQTAQPWAWGASAYYRLDSQHFAAQRFSLHRPTRLGRIGVWSGFMSHGTGFAAIFPLQNASSLPPHPNDPLLEQKAVASAVITTEPSTEELFADFQDVELPSGHYAVMLGSGRFGTSGALYMLNLDDGVIVPSTLRIAPQFPGWLDLAGQVYSIRITGLMSEVAADTDALDFGEVLVDDFARQTITLTNHRDHAALEITGAVLSGSDAGEFEVATDITACASIAIGATCSFSVDYRPQTIAPHTALLSISSDGIPDPIEIPLSGLGLPSAWVTPAADANGAIHPDTPQLAGIGSTVTFTLTPDTGFHVAAVDGSCGGTLEGQVYTTAAIKGDCAVDASFALNHYALTYVAGNHGSIQGDAAQSIGHGGTGSAVTAVADTGYHFAQWSDGRNDNPRIDSNVIAAVTVEAQFAINTYSLSYTAGSHGSIEGDVLQTVAHGDQGTPVTAVPETGYHFVQWSDGRNDNPRTDTGVTSSLDVSAAFAINTYTVTASSTGNGTLSPTGTQSVEHGATAEFEVTPESGYVAIMGGSCGGDLEGGTFVTAAVIGDCSVTADFVPPVSLHVVMGDNQSAVVGMPFDQALRVLALDVDAQPVPGIDIRFQPPVGGASMSPPQATVTTGSDGMAALGAIANMTAGSYTVRASADDFPAAAAVDFNLENRLPVATLSASVSDGRDYVRHGQVVDYIVEVENAGPDPVTGLSLAMSLADSLDVESATWQCLTPVSGCTDSGTGALQDSGLLIAAGQSATYVVTVTTRMQTKLATTMAAVDAAAPGLAAFADDETTLVILRNGFDPDMDEDAKQAGLKAGPLRPMQRSSLSSADIVAIDQLAAGVDGIVTLWHDSGPDGVTFRVDQLQGGTVPYVRIVATHARAEQASAWLRAPEGEPVLVSRVTADGRSMLLLSTGIETIELELDLEDTTQRH